MSIAVVSTHNTMGVRTLGGVPPLSMRAKRHRGGYLTLGAAPSSDTLSELVSAGYDPAMLQTFVALGATNEQLQALPYPASPDEIAAASQQLMGALTSSSAVSTAAVQPAQDIGTLQSQANDLVAKVRAMQNDLQPMIQQALAAATSGNPWPSDRGNLLASQQGDLVSITNRVNAVYRAAFGTVAPGLSGMGIDPVTIAAAAAAVTVILAAIAVWWNHEQTLKAQIAVQQTQANTQQQVAAAATQQANSMTQQAAQFDQAAAAAAAKGDFETSGIYSQKAASLRQQAAALVSKASTVASGGDTAAQVGEFFQKYWPYFAIGAGALIVLPMLTGKRR